ncbi:Tetratricopeptide repeat protein [anaerobic digester metagenome]
MMVILSKPIPITKIRVNELFNSFFLFIKIIGDLMVICPNCKFDNDEELVYCDECGTVLSVEIKDIMGEAAKYSKAKEYEKAIEYYHKTIKINPKFDIAYAKIGNAFNSLGKPEEAVNYLDKALELDPNDGQPWRYKANSFRKLGKYSEAADSFYMYENLDNPELSIKNKFLYNLRQDIGLLVKGFDYEKISDVLLVLEGEVLRLHYKGTFGRDKGLTEIRVKDITSIGFHKGLISGKIEIRFSGGDILIGRILEKKEASLFVDNVNNRKRILNNPTTIINKPVAEKSIIDLGQIKEAKELLDVGAISEEEFKEIKKRILDK